MSSTGASTQEKLSGLTQEFHIKEPGKKKKIYTSKSLYESKINAPQGSPDDSFQQLINGSLISSKPPNISSIESLVSQVIDNVQKNEVLEIIKNLDLSINSFDLTEGGIVKFNLGLGQLMPIGSLGDGVARAFFIACHAAGEKAVQNGILLIDEIENGLHYSSQDKLWKWLFKVAKEKNIQIFATTHSEDCEKSFIKASKEFVDSLEKKSTTNSKNKTRKEDLDPSRLYRLEKKLDHTFRVEPYDYKSLDVSINDLGVETR
jgi:predicted ATP-dependent endonuclease of OLD family